MKKIALAALAAILLATPLAASAQDVPSYAQAPTQDEQVRGRIVDFDGAYSLHVRDERGFIDRVELHQGTIINPTGITLQPGMTVSILGYNSGDFLAANEIDTPYTFDAGVPYYGGHPWDYYGPSISLGFFFGDLGWWHGSYFHGPFDYRGGARVYNDVTINNIYRGGDRHYYTGYRGNNPGEGYHGGREPRAGNPGYVNPSDPGRRLPRTEDPGHTYTAPGHYPTEGYRGAPRDNPNPGTFHGRDFVAPRERGGYYRGGSAPAVHSAPHAESHASGEHRPH